MQHVYPHTAVGCFIAAEAAAVGKVALKPKHQALTNRQL